MDTHIYNGYRVPQYYDSLIGKIISYGETRAVALARMRQALDELVVEGIRTNTPLHRELVLDRAFDAMTWQIVLMAAFGAGLTWGASVLRW